MPRIYFINGDDMKIAVEAKEGLSVLEVAQLNNIELEGYCGGALACGACHVILNPKEFAILPAPSDEENDVLDLVQGLTETSRLACQIIITKDMEGMTFKLPKGAK